MKSSIQFILGLVLGSTAHAFAPSQVLRSNAPSTRHGRARRATADERVEQLRLEGEARIAAKQEINKAYREMKAKLERFDHDDAASAVSQSEASARIEQLRSEGAARLDAREKMTSAYMAELKRLKIAEAAAEESYNAAKIARLEKEGQERIARRADLAARYAAAKAEIYENSAGSAQAAAPAPSSAASANAATLDRWTAMKSEGQAVHDKRNQMAAAYQAQLKKLNSAEANAEESYNAAKIARLEKEGQERVTARAEVKSLYDAARSALDKQDAFNAKFEELRAAGEAVLAERSAKNKMYAAAKAAVKAMVPAKSKTLADVLLNDVDSDVLKNL